MSRATFLILRYVMCELAVSTLPSGFPVKVRAWFSHISTGFEKIEWSANNDHEWNAKNDHRWVIFIASKTIKGADIRFAPVPTICWSVGWLMPALRRDVSATAETAFPYG